MKGGVLYIRRGGSIVYKGGGLNALSLHLLALALGCTCMHLL